MRLKTLAPMVALPLAACIGPSSAPDVGDENVHDLEQPAEAGTVLWTKTFGTKTRFASVAVDANGNILVTGSFQGAVDFGDGSIFPNSAEAAFVAKYDLDGNHLWSHALKTVGAKSVSGSQIAVDAQGNVFFSGAHTHVVMMEGQTLVPSSKGAFVGKFGSAGALQWVKAFSYGSAAISTSNYIHIEDQQVAPNGDLVVVGNFRGSVDFGGGALTSGSDQKGDVFLARFSSNGDHVMSRRFGAGTPVVQALAVDGAGNLLLAGAFSGPADFGGGPLYNEGVQDDVFLVKLTASGNHLWSKRFGDGWKQSAYGVTADASGNVFLAGYYFGTLNFGGVPLKAVGSDGFVAKFSSSGEHIWSTREDLAVNEANPSLGVVADGAGGVFVAGRHAAPVGVWIAQYDTSGALAWKGAGSGTAQHEFARDVAATPDDNLVTIGHAQAGGFFAKVTTSGEPDPPPPSNCCEAGDAPGCNVPTVEQCVCSEDSYCCNVEWDNQCVGEVEGLGCGQCP